MHPSLKKKEEEWELTGHCLPLAEPAATRSFIYDLTHDQCKFVPKNKKQRHLLGFGLYMGWMTKPYTYRIVLRVLPKTHEMIIASPAAAAGQILLHTMKTKQTIAIRVQSMGLPKNMRPVSAGRFHATLEAFYRHQVAALQILKRPTSFANPMDDIVLAAAAPPPPPIGTPSPLSHLLSIFLVQRPDVK